MATIIDYFPVASNADSVISAFRGTPQSLSFPLAPSNIFTDRDAASTFITGSPDMLFVAEYFVNSAFAGVIVSFENFYGATHYSVYKRDKFSVASDWKRILVLDKTALDKENKQFLPYVNNTLGIPLLPRQGYCILDTQVKTDRIYEYKVVAGYFPQSEVLHYDIVMDSQGLLRYIAPNPGETTDTYAKRIFGDTIYDWAIALVNDLPFFDKTSATAVIPSTMKTVASPLDLNVVAKVFVQSVYYFGLVKSVTNLLNNVRTDNQNQAFFDAVAQSFDTNAGTFSFRGFDARLKSVYPAYGVATTKLSNYTNTVGKVTDFSYDDVGSFDNYATLNLFMLRLKTLYINVMNAAPVS